MNKYVVMATERECLEAAAHIVGQTLSKVAYVGLTYEQPETVRWHFADWHWPEVGVELATSTGDLAYAIWDHEVSQHELTLALGPMSDRWLPLRPDSLVSARRWDVSDSEEWAPMVQNTIDSCEVILGDVGNPPVSAPVAIRLQAGAGTAWIIVAGPISSTEPPERLSGDRFFLGHDEVIVTFDDEVAGRLGVHRAEGHAEQPGTY